MRKTMLGLAALLAVGLTTTLAHANGPVPPVMVGPVVITGSEAEKMINELSHHRHEHYRAGRALDWLYQSPAQPALTPGIPPIYVNNVLIVGHEAEEMIDRLSHMRHHGHWRAGMPLDWLGIQSAMPMPMPSPVMVPVAPMAMAPYPPPPPMPMMVAAPAPVIIVNAPPPPAKKDDEPRLGRFIIGVNGGGDTSEVAAGVGLTIEGKRWGFNLNYGMTVFDANLQTRKIDLKLIDAHLVFAPIVGQRGRVRIEVGANAAYACGAFMIAPELGLSGDVRILGPLGISGYVRGSIWPYKRIDAFAGVMAQLSILRLELGWREMRLETTFDNGKMVADRWGGPNLGVSVVF
ncbi:MAG TPA: hypothetical protein VGK67_12395 [Myxococcales bacterium]